MGSKVVREQSDGRPKDGTGISEFHLERYRYILQQLGATNENVHRFLALYQTLATTIAAAALALFVGYRKWSIDPNVAKAGVIGLFVLLTVVAAFTALLIVVGVMTWIDYRREECELTTEMVGQNFRSPPRLRNFFRWYETYVLGFVLVSVSVMWMLAVTYVIPAIK
ncbi:hypothetical protein [Micromonospora aurantiaca]|uniref:hypothetical protein n=1 Tax=Micromonospora aurantiaca (nom. illeg.) TaxID=47850 RepID=UPI001E61FF09|nr:hypothetical protein [Micromonospora aurantiaca]UFN94256.1 hypothetical protein LF814_30650 [Micromonospora aurantiaca]